MRVLNRRGYTLVELVVVVLIIGILTSIAVPQYLLSVETGKADDAVATLNMIGTTNKMFALDHSGFYTSGPFPSGPGSSCFGTYGNPCTGAGACPANVTATQTNACILVCCNYLADQDWGDKPYTFTAVDGSVAPNKTATAARAPSTWGSGGTAFTAYQAWGYYVSITGQITATNSGSSTPPTPPPTY